MRADVRTECRLLMQWTAPTAGIAMCHIAVAVEGRRESAYGYKPIWAGQVDTQPSPNELHALITPPELLHLTHRRPRHSRWKPTRKFPIKHLEEALVRPFQFVYAL